MIDAEQAGEPGPETASEEIRLRMGSCREFLDPLHALAERFCQRVGFSDDEIYWCITAIREAVTNAVIHGNRERPGTHVDVLLAREGNRVEITVIDEGEGFDPESLPDPVSEEHLLDASGRGVYLIRQLMDEVSFTFPEEGGTSLRMVKTRGA